MANTYSQVHIQLVFAVKYRDAAIHKSWRGELYKYITGIVQENNHKLISINGMPDHVHVLVGMRPSQSISDLMQDIKANSSKWINDKNFVRGRFEWQDGYGAFSYGKSQLQEVIAYISDQERHHSKMTFREEYLGFLKKFDVDYDERYIFKDLISQ
jgi:REP element-mobilizing transposase RayT